MITKEYTIDLKDNQTLYLVPFGDVHYNVDACDKPRFHRLIKWLVKRRAEGNLVRMIGMGDYNDMFSPSERRKMANADLHDSSYEQIDKLIEQIVKDFSKAVWPMKEDILGLVGHHHLSEFSNRSKYPYKNSDHYLAHLLECDYYGTTALIQLNFPHKLKLKITAHHGYGGGRTPGYLVSKRMNQAGVFPNAQIVLMGHDHHKLAYPDSGLDIDPKSPDGIKDIKRHYIATGSFLRGYMPGTEGSYVEKTLLRPADLGVTILMIRMEKYDGRYKIDWHTSV